MPTPWKAMPISLSSQVPCSSFLFVWQHLLAVLDSRREQREAALIFCSIVELFGLFKQFAEVMKLL